MLALASLLLLAAAAAASPQAPYNLKVNGRLPSAVSGVGLLTVDLSQPIRFAWSVAHSENGKDINMQRVVIVEHGTGSAVWESDLETLPGFLPFTQYVYDGPTLKANTGYRWTVSWQDTDGQWSPPSTAKFHTSLAQWDSSAWIGGNTPMLRNEFSLSDTDQAVVHVAGEGFFQLFINGKRVDTDALSGAWTKFDQRVLYFSYNVSTFLNRGNNAIGVLVGRGWRNKESFPPKTSPSSCDDNERLLRLELSVGGKAVVGTSNKWNASNAGPIVSDSVYDGETYDATKEQDGWASSGFKMGSDWSPASAVPCFNPTLTPISIPTVQFISENKPKRFLYPKSGTTVVDFGDNLSGFSRLKVKGPKGTTITLRHAEVLQHPPYGPADGNVYTGNLRSAKATDTYTLKGDPAGEVFEPHFTYHGFQFVEVTGYPGNLTEDSLTQVHFHTNNAIRSHFHSSSNVLNAIQQNALTGQGSNSMTVPTDCDQRDERLGWMGDAGLSADTFAINYDVSAFQENYVRNMMDEMVGGSLPDTVPFARYGGRPADPSWSAAFPQNLYVQYKIAGNLQPARDTWAQLGAYFDEVADQVSKAGGFDRWKPPYGDWVPAGAKIPGQVCSAANYIINVQQALELAHAMQASSNISSLTALQSKLVSDFNSAFFDHHKQCWSDCGQASYALAVVTGAAKAAGVSDDTIAKALVHDIVNENNNHVTVGIIGAKALFPALTQVSQQNAAVTLAEQTSQPSWGYMIFNTVEPATSSLWELWNSPTSGPGMNSRNHHMFSSISAWLVQSVGGVTVAPNGTVDLLASSAVDVASAATTVESHVGKVSLTYRRHGGTQCAKTPEGRSSQRPYAAEVPDAVLQCGELGGTIGAIEFASFGSPSGSCGGFQADAACHTDVTALVRERCSGKAACSLPADPAAWGVPDSCQHLGHSPRSLFVQATCSGKAAVTAEVHLPPSTTATLRVPRAQFGDELATIQAVRCSNGKIQQLDVLVNGDEATIALGSGQHRVTFSTESKSSGCM